MKVPTQWAPDPSAADHRSLSRSAHWGRAGRQGLYQVHVTSDGGEPPTVGTDETRAIVRQAGPKRQRALPVTAC